MQGLKFINRALFAAAVVALPANAAASSGTMSITSDTTLTEDHNGTIIIDADDVTLNCQGRRVSAGGDFSNGIVAAGVRNVRVVNCWVTGFFEAITLFDTQGVILENNEIVDGETAILARGGGVLTITGNTIFRNTVGVDIQDCSQVFVSNNLVAYHRGEGITLRSVIDAYIENNPFIGHNGSDGLDVESGTLIRITNNRIGSNGGHGVDLRMSNSCTVQHNDLRHNASGPFRVMGGSDNITEPNTL
jgi:parallel beta-helix repeat protein